LVIGFVSKALESSESGKAARLAITRGTCLTAENGDAVTVIGGLFTSTLLTLLLLPVLYEWIFEKENLVEAKKKVEEHPARA
jgi:hypothetical protein